MSTFKDRLLEEKAQLDERGNKLELGEYKFFKINVAGPPCSSCGL